LAEARGRPKLSAFGERLSVRFLMDHNAPNGRRNLRNQSRFASERPKIVVKNRAGERESNPHCRLGKMVKIDPEACEHGLSLAVQGIRRTRAFR
jgi:hypothetical protein